MASYAAGNAGGQKGQVSLQKFFKTLTMVVPEDGHQDEILQEIINMPDVMSLTLDLYSRSEYIEARSKLEDLLRIYTEINIPKTGFAPFDDLVVHVTKKTRGLILCAMAVCQFSLASIDEALAFSEQAMAVGQETGDAQLMKIALSDRGHMEMILGNYYTALDLIEQGLEIDASSHDPWRKRNRTLQNLAVLYSNIGDSGKAYECIEESLRCAEDEEDIIGAAKALNAKGVLLCGEEKFEEARSSFEAALKLSIEKLRNSSLQGLVLNNLAALYFDMSDLERAEHYLDEAIRFADLTADGSLAGYAYSGKAILSVENGDFDGARSFADRALDAYAKGQDAAGQVDLHFMLGMIARHGFDDLDNAYDHFKASIELSEKIRAGIGLDDLKICYAVTYAVVYRSMVDLCVEMDYVEEAFQYIERSKSRALVDMLSGAIDVNPQVAVSRELSIIRARLDLLRKELKKSHLTLVKRTDRELAGDAEGHLTEELIELERNYAKTYKELKTKDPEWLSFVSVDAISSGSASELIDNSSAILNLFQTQDALVVVIVKNGRGPLLVRMPVDGNLIREKVISVTQSIAAGKGSDIKSHEYIREVRQPLSYLYDLVLAPLKEHIEGISHLIISPHLFWHYLPFPALYNREKRCYLLDEYAVSLVPSATALSFCLEKNKEYSASRRADRQRRALILANPSHDLPYAEQEADLVGRFFQAQGKSCSIFRGSDASFDKLAEYGSSDIVHLACHGYFREDNPLFSCVVLSDGDGNECPFYVPDIFNVHLDTSLVTLSACETGVSQYTSGDELLGLMRAFFYAGTPSIVASLWAVNDRSTSVFMESLYKAFIEKKIGRAQALSYAMKATKSIPDYAHPYYWAAFFLSGDWR